MDSSSSSNNSSASSLPDPSEHRVKCTQCESWVEKYEMRQHKRGHQTDVTTSPSVTRSFQPSRRAKKNSHQMPDFVYYWLQKHNFFDQIDPTIESPISQYNPVLRLVGFLLVLVDFFLLLWLLCLHPGFHYLIDFPRSRQAQSISLPPVRFCEIAIIQFFKYP